MGWIESPPFFCAASKMGRDAASQYTKTPVGSLPTHEFTKYTTTSEYYKRLPQNKEGNGFSYMLEVYVDDYITLAVPISHDQLDHVSNAILKGICDVFPEGAEDSEDPISLRKVKKEEGMWAIMKDILGFNSNGLDNTI